MTRKTKEMTKLQARVLEFMQAFFTDNDQLPPGGVIADHFGWASNNAAVVVCAALHRAGKLSRNAVGKYKFAR